jgi:hypothetical protein
LKNKKDLKIKKDNSKMNLKERKKEISKKLDYIGYNEKQKKRALKINYNLKKIISKGYLDFEERVNNYYQLIKNNKEYEKIRSIENIIIS